MINILRKQNGINIVGQGGKIILFMLPSLIAAMGVHKYLPDVAALPESISFIKPLGYLLLLLGLILWGSAVTQLLMGFSKGRLVTTGAYGVVRNPIYSSVTFFILPAVALLVVALSPLLFHFAIRQTSVHLSLVVLAILLLALGSFYLFLDENGHPIINYRLAGLIFTLYSIFIWITIGRMRNAEGIRLSNNPNSVIGLIGETRTDIEAYSAGSVLVEGELWQARSKKAIPAGSTVRVLRLDGFWLTVKELEPLTKK
jgi:membrane-bound ClpP family serine protease